MSAKTNDKTILAALPALASFLEYPEADFDRRMSHAQAFLGHGITDCTATRAFSEFARAMLALSPDEREELFTATFDVTPACVVYASIHLFGEENFKRGEFMAALNARYEQNGYNPGGELPDHLAVLLRFAAETDDAELRELVEFCLLGPLGKMIAALSGENPYRALLETVREVLLRACPGAKPATSPLDRMRQPGVSCAVTVSGCGCGHEPTAEPQPDLIGGQINVFTH